MNNKWIKSACVVAMIAALAGAVADILLLYNPEGGYEKGDYLFLLDISEQRLLAGSYLGILVIPMEILGLFHVYESLKPAGKIFIYPVIFLGVYLIFPGVAYHGTVALTATYIKLKSALPSDEQSVIAENFAFIRSAFEPLGAILFTGFALVSLLFSYTVAFQKTQYRQWIAICNPLAFYMLWVGLYLWVPKIGTFLMPAGFNLAFFLFFLCSLLASKSKFSER